MNMTLNVAPQWREGPDINILHHRLTEFPKEWMSSKLPNYFTALVHDAIYDHCDSVNASDLNIFRRPHLQCEWYRMSLLIVFFICDECFEKIQFNSNSLISLLEETAKDLAQAGTNQIYIDDLDRREELIRVVLNTLSLYPKGETSALAEDRLQAVSSQERLKVLQASRVAEQRSHELRTALAKQKAKEAADKMTRE